MADQSDDEPLIVIETTGKHADDEKDEWLRGQAEAAHERGVTFVRVSYHPDQPDRLLFEGWTRRPREQGPLRWTERAHG